MMTETTTNSQEQQEAASYDAKQPETIRSSMQWLETTCRDSWNEGIVAALRAFLDCDG
jgi:hypothetical protein